ncbi:hypothetical protein BUALT_Bualt07G0113100 [Buddleja alternifolia]|uniref:Disease resistance protein winged helix domain-containing protein n=1 Tax=Buddleja alternifolia TaxID=168488 RepID=A0AAV6XHP5_9LAMI|nr:hypothetical protein BUALT_Bualt07G0113100 [Buddleja alternifolia]
MATAYAALVSLMHLLKRMLHPCKQWISFDREQIISLNNMVCSLVDLLEDLSNRRRSGKFVTEELKKQIADAGHEAEDIIESYVADAYRVLNSAVDDSDSIEVETRKTEFLTDIKRVAETMHLIKIEIEKKKMDVEKGDHQRINSSPEEVLSRRAPSSDKLDVMVGFEDHLDKMMRRLATTESKLQIIPIVGMAGIGDDDYCLKLLSLSYNDLPIHLKPCFLYMAMFPEDCEIKISRLIKLWVAEGFLKPIKDKSLEDVAMVYLKDLMTETLF